MADLALTDRIDRLESYAAIQQLPLRFAFASDGRDLDTLVGLYVSDVKVGPPVNGTGREALREWFKVGLAAWYRSLHLVGAHAIEVQDPDHATGIVQCRVEQERGDSWLTMVFNYRDEYERRDGQWFFRRRRPQPAWCYDHSQRPHEGFRFFPQSVPTSLPQGYPHFGEFWKQASEAEIAAVTGHPVDSDGR